MPSPVFTLNPQNYEKPGINFFDSYAALAAVTAY